MSQKRQLSTMDNIESLTDQELRLALKGYSQMPGPITDSTRNLYRKKLESLMNQDVGEEEPSLTKKLIAQDDDDDYDDDTSDEDYEGESEDDDEEEDEEDEDEEDDLEDEINPSNVRSESDLLTTSIIVGPNASPNRISTGILISLAIFFVFISVVYFYSKDYITEPMKPATKLIMLLLASSPFSYGAYWIICLYNKRRHEEKQCVCNLVSDALELLQSPDNPKGLMPILHIRDTLLTASERETKNMVNLWNKAVKFIEDNESRVKAELVNIDGEDFRAWKWIGSKKL